LQGGNLSAAADPRTDHLPIGLTRSSIRRSPRGAVVWGRFDLHGIDNLPSGLRGGFSSAMPELTRRRDFNHDREPCLPPDRAALGSPIADDATARIEGASVEATRHGHRPFRLKVILPNGVHRLLRLEVPSTLVGVTFLEPLNPPVRANIPITTVLLLFLYSR